jgi:hypothetical protein
MTSIPENNKKPGICYAWADASADTPALELPVIDLTHPAFAFQISDAELNTLIDGMVTSSQRLAAMPASVLQSIIQKSILMRGMLVDSANTYTTGIMTYLNKLGPDNLGEGYAGPADRQWAASLTPVTFRWRMRDVARLLAASLEPSLAIRSDTPLHLLNIAGGPGMDSLNALILIHKEHPQYLTGRKITIHLLDLDLSGPIFGARALSALLAQGAPLAGLDASFEYQAYDWSQPQKLAEILTRFTPDTISAGSSEGGLFEYATDEEIAANLQVLHACTPPGFSMVGPVIRDSSTLDPRLKETEHVPNRPAVRYLGLEKFALLAGPAGWRIEKSLDGPMHQVILLVKNEK